jgi:SAM-dependent methyltransferase
LCGAVSRKLLYVREGYEIVRCRRCGLVFVDNSPPGAELIALYDEGYYEDGELPGYAGYADAEARKRHHARTLLAELERMMPMGRLVEIGCAYGYFLDEARARGWTVSGVEPAVHAADYARRELGLEVVDGSVAELAMGAGSVDAVTLWDVIEHLPEPRATLEVAASWLREGGVLALSTGNVGSLMARLHGADWSLMTPPWHQYYFSKRTLRALLELTGFTLERFHGDGRIAVDPSSPHPRIRGRAAKLLQHPTLTRVARRLGAGGVMYAFARKGRT